MESSGKGRIPPCPLFKGGVNPPWPPFQRGKQRINKQQLKIIKDMEKTRQFDFEKIEVCRNCGGTGKEKTVLGLLRSRCPVCEGSGRVKKTTEITITVRAFRGENK